MSDMISGLSNMYTNGTYSSATENLKDKLGTTDYSKATDEELMELSLILIPYTESKLCDVEPSFL